MIEDVAGPVPLEASAREGAPPLAHSLTLPDLATRALEWRTWSRGRLFGALFEKYQPILAVRFPSLRLGSAVRAVYVGVSICGMCFLNALLFESAGIPRDSRCDDAQGIASPLALFTAAVTVGCKAGILALVNFIVSKEVCYQYPDSKRLATVHGWETREKIAIVVGTLYLIGTSSYVAVFLFMVPHYAAYTYLLATVVSIAVIEILKPFLQALLLTIVLKSKYGISFAAHFPQLSDFSHRYVLEDAEFTHAHWAELTRVLNSSTETEAKLDIAGDEAITVAVPLGLEASPNEKVSGEGVAGGTGPSADQVKRGDSDAMVKVMFEGADTRTAGEADVQLRRETFRCGPAFFSCAPCVADPEKGKDLEVDESRVKVFF